MVHPKKHLGQHFLTDPGIAERIVGSLDPGSEAVLEIGPGKGILTKILLEKKFADFKVVEIDGEAVEYLKTEFPELADRILYQDFLKFKAEDAFPGAFSIIGNFPYNISSQILFKVLESRGQVDQVVGMFQKEVAERVISPPGSKKYGILSVLVQAFYEVQYLFTVHEGSFFPAPRVKSAVIALRRNSVDELGCSETLFFDVVKTAFNQRRKTLRNALKRFQPDEVVPISLLGQRAEQLSVEEFVKLTNFIETRNPS